MAIFVGSLVASMQTDMVLEKELRHLETEIVTLEILGVFETSKLTPSTAPPPTREHLLTLSK